MGQKISLVVAVLGIIGLSVGIMNWTSGGTSMRPLVSGADSKDLSEVVELLKNNPIHQPSVLFHLNGSDVKCVRTHVNFGQQKK